MGASTDGRFVMDIRVVLEIDDIETYNKFKDKKSKKKLTDYLTKVIMEHEKRLGKEEVAVTSEDRPSVSENAILSRLDELEELIKRMAVINAAINEVSTATEDTPIVDNDSFDGFPVEESNETKSEDLGEDGTNILTNIFKM